LKGGRPETNESKVSKVRHGTKGGKKKVFKSSDREESLKITPKLEEGGGH